MGGDVRPSGEDADAAMAERREMLDGDAARHRLVERDGVIGRRRHAAAEQHGRDIDLAHEAAAMLGVRPGRDQDEPGDPLRAHHLQDAHLVVDVLVGVVDEGHVAGAHADRLDDARHRREERVGDVGQDEPDQAGIAASQRLGGAVRQIADRRDRLLDALDHLLADRRRTVDHRRDGRDGDSGAAGDILDGGHDSSLAFS